MYIYIYYTVYVSICKYAHLPNHHSETKVKHQKKNIWIKGRKASILLLLVFNASTMKLSRWYVLSNLKLDPLEKIQWNSGDPDAYGASIPNRNAIVARSVGTFSNSKIRTSDKERMLWSYFGFPRCMNWKASYVFLGVGVLLLCCHAKGLVGIGALWLRRWNFNKFHLSASRATLGDAYNMYWSWNSPNKIKASRQLVVFAIPLCNSRMIPWNGIHWRYQVVRNLFKTCSLESCPNNLSCCWIKKVPCNINQQ